MKSRSISTVRGVSAPTPRIAKTAALVVACALSFVFIATLMAVHLVF